jgi:hypothetical protein
MVQDCCENFNDKDDLKKYLIMVHNVIKIDVISIRHMQFHKYMKVILNSGLKELKRN